MMKIASIVSALLLAAPLVSGMTAFFGLTAEQKVSCVCVGNPHSRPDAVYLSDYLSYRKCI